MIVKTLKSIWNLESVKSELREGGVSSKRTYEILIAFLTLSLGVNFLQVFVQVFFKEPAGGFSAAVIGLAVSILLLLILYGLGRYILKKFFNSNGGSSGVFFLDRTFLLGVHFSLKMILFVSVLLVLFLSLLQLSKVLFPTSVALVVGGSFLLIAGIIAAMIWVLVNLNRSLKDVSGTLAKSEEV